MALSLAVAANNSTKVHFLNQSNLVWLWFFCLFYDREV